MNELRIHASTKDDASGPIQHIEDRLRAVQKAGATGIISGIAAGATVAALNLVQNAVGDVVGTVGEFVKAGVAAEATTARLKASLEANVPGWDGNIAAIQAYTESGSKLGFTNDEMASSLARLVAATHDVTKAQQVLSVAQDLARFKNISLSDATDALTKVEAGSFRILKSLGIDLPKGTSQFAALAAVEKVAGGQAKAFGDTTAGAMDKANAAWANAQEAVGQKLLPAVTALATFASTELIPDFLKLADTVGKNVDALSKFAGGIGDVLSKTTGSKNVLGDLGQGLDVAAYGFLHAGDTSGYFAMKTQEAVDAANAGNKPVQDLASSVDSVSQSAENATTDMRGFTVGVDHSNDVLNRVIPRFENFATKIAKVGSDAALAVSHLEGLYGAIGGSAEAKAALADAEIALQGVKDKIDALTKKPARTIADNLQLTSLEGQLADAKLKVLDAEIVLARIGDKPAKQDILKFLDSMTAKAITAETELGRLGLMNLAGVPGAANGGGSSKTDLGMKGPGSSHQYLNINLTSSSSLITPGSAAAIAREIGPYLFKWAQQNGLMPRIGLKIQ